MTVFISLKWNAWAHRTSIAPPLLIEARGNVYVY